ncbi:hypothetical protein ACQ4PT_002976 [Festuca glaucescens]
MSHKPCAPAGYVDYLCLFYCGFGAAPAVVGYAAFLLWLRLLPAVAGVTRLSLGNDAPDVFAGVVSFAVGDSRDGGRVGLNSVLGDALFVSTVVAGVIAIAAGSRGVGGAVVELRGFVRDLCFLFSALRFLVVVWVATSFVSLYAAYVVIVWTSQCCADLGKPPHPDLAPLAQAMRHGCKEGREEEEPHEREREMEEEKEQDREVGIALRLTCGVDVEHKRIA